MDQAMRQFEKRAQAVTQRHRKLARGYVTKMGPDGLLHHQPRRQMPSLPWRGFLFLAAGFFAFKGLLLASLGTATYTTRVETLQAGTVFERAGAWLMQLDPVMVWFASYFAPFLG